MDSEAGFEKHVTRVLLNQKAEHPVNKGICNF